VGLDKSIELVSSNLDDDGTGSEGNEEKKEDDVKEIEIKIEEKPNKKQASSFHNNKTIPIENEENDLTESMRRRKK
jgi:hypothetical protein